MKYAILLICGLACCASAPPPAIEGVSFEERLLATIPEGWEVPNYWNRFVFSPTGGSAAYVVRLGDESCFLVHEGRKGPVVRSVGADGPIDEQGAPVFSPNGRRLAYAARLGPINKGPWTVVLDGVAGPTFDDVGDPVFSPDGRRVAYDACEGGKWFVVLDGEHVGRQYQHAEGLVFSPDSKRWACRARDKGPLKEDGNPEWQKAHVVVDGAPGPEFEWIHRSVRFSPGSKTIAYFATKGDEYYAVVGHEIVGRHAIFTDFAFSSDGREFVFSAEGPVEEGSVLYFPSRRETVPFHAICGLRYLPDSRRIAFKGSKPKPAEVELLPRQFAVIDGAVGEEGDRIGDIVCTRKRTGYTMTQGKRAFVVVDGRKLEGEYDSVESLTFSADGRHHAFVAFKEGECFLVCDSRESESFDIVRDPVFSPDGRKVAFAARKNRELWWRVMDVK